MKKLSILLMTLSFIALGCNSKSLNEKSATEQIIKKYQYPKIVDYEIFCGDPVHAKRILDSGLEEKGLVKVVRVQTFKDLGKPLIYFTDLAKPYLMETPEVDREHKIQRVKIGVLRFGGIIKILADSSNKNVAVVEYTTILEKNSFAVLWMTLPIKQIEKAYFLMTDDGWQLIDKKDAELMILKIY